MRRSRLACRARISTAPRTTMKQAVEGWPRKKTAWPRGNSRRRRNRDELGDLAGVEALRTPRGAAGRADIERGLASGAPRLRADRDRAPAPTSACLPERGLPCTLAFSARSFSEISSVTACWTRSAAGTRCATSARKSSRSMNQPSSLPRAVTVAVQVPRSISAISPNTPPASSVATVSFSPPGSSTVASPCRPSAGRRRATGRRSA